MTRPIPRRATSEEDAKAQRDLLTTAVRSCVVIVEYVDENLGLAEAHDKATGERVSLTWNTVGVDFKTLVVGARLSVDVTAFNVAVVARNAGPQR